MFVIKKTNRMQMATYENHRCVHVLLVLDQELRIVFIRFPLVYIPEADPLVDGIMRDYSRLLECGEDLFQDRLVVIDGWPSIHVRKIECVDTYSESYLAVAAGTPVWT